MLYTRLREDGLGFEPQRNLMTRTRHLDGGGSVAADDSGNVYVVFHANLQEEKADESTRAVYIARSADDGASFTTEAPVDAKRSGACSCCGLKALAPSKGTLLVSYRSAADKVNRDMTLLRSSDGGP